MKKVTIQDLNTLFAQPAKLDDLDLIAEKIEKYMLYIALDSAHPCGLLSIFQDGKAYISFNTGDATGSKTIGIVIPATDLKFSEL